jgi:hypothetical protein
MKYNMLWLPGLKPKRVLSHSTNNNQMQWVLWYGMRGNHTQTLLSNKRWQSIKNKKKPFMPNHTKHKREDGTTASSSQKPDMLADHLEKQQWAKPNSLAADLPTNKIFDTHTHSSPNMPFLHRRT